MRISRALSNRDPQFECSPISFQTVAEKLGWLAKYLNVVSGHATFRTNLSTFTRLYKVYFESSFL